MPGMQTCQQSTKRDVSCETARCPVPRYYTGTVITHTSVIHRVNSLCGSFLILSEKIFGFLLRS
jgi:hypothetical protein